MCWQYRLDAPVCQAPRQQNEGWDGTGRDGMVRDGTVQGLGAQQVPLVGQKTHTKHLWTPAGRRNSTAKHRVPPQPPRHVVAKGMGIALDPHHLVLHLQLQSSGSLLLLPQLLLTPQLTFSASKESISLCHRPEPDIPNSVLLTLVVKL